MSSVSNLGPNKTQISQKPLPKSWPKVTDGSTQGGSEPLPQDAVQLTSAPLAASLKVETPAVPLVPIAVTLEIPTNAIGGLFSVIPVLLAKGQVGEPEAGTPFAGAPVLDAHVTSSAPTGQRPVALSVKDLPREQAPSDKQHYPALMSQKGQIREERDLEAAVGKSLNEGNLSNQRTFVTLTLGLDQQGLEDLGNQDIVFAPSSRMDPESGQWKAGSESFLQPKFVSANFLDEDQNDSTAPVVEYLLVDELKADLDFLTTVEQAREGRSTKTTTLETEWQGERVKFDVEVSERFKKVLDGSPQLSFDAQTGVIQETGPDGRVSEMNLSLTPELQKVAGDKLELPPWLLKPEGIHSVALPKDRVVVDVDPLTRHPVATCPDGYIFPGAVKPEADKVYSVDTQTPAGPHTVNVRFSERAAGSLGLRGVTFSKSHALLYSLDGTKMSLDSRSHEQQDPEALTLRQAFGLRPLLTDADQAWTVELFTTASQAVYGVPKYGVEIQVDEKGAPKVVRLGEDGTPLTEALDDNRGLETGHRTFRKNRDQRILSIIQEHSDFPKTSVHVPVIEKRVNDHLLVRAPNEKVSQQAERLSKLFLGPNPQNEAVDVTAFNKFRAKYKKKVSAESAAKEFNAYAKELSQSPEVRKELAAVLGQEWKSQSMNELVEDATRGLQRNSPVEVTVVPKGADINHYLNEGERASRKGARTEMAAFVSIPKIEFVIGQNEIPPTRVFVAEEYFETPEKRAVVGHELLHAFMEVYASSEDHDAVDKAYEKSLAGEREFSSLYGALEREFVPTLGEEFMSLHGPEGPAWVKKEHPEVYAVLSKLTGFDPLGGVPVNL